MRLTPQMLQRVLSVVALLAGVATIALVVLWPAFAQNVLSSRTWAALLAIWFFVVAGYAHPEFRKGIAQGIREFRRNCDDLF